ncbi:MAG: hypothetical protein O7C62_03855 [Rickettsia endosymbiont of Ixodes persulcatus]|nr:hypothetical protein [Rickettsia endosymbiont of Ixodes persulcatus]
MNPKTLSLPQEDDGFLQLSLKGPEGSSLESSTKVVTEAEKILANYKDILGHHIQGLFE